MSTPETRLAVLGSTGSIGRQTMEVVRALPGRFRVVALAAGHNLDLLAAQVTEFKPRFISFAGTPSSESFAGVIKAAGCKNLPLAEIAAHPDVDVVLVATSGGAGLEAVMAAVKAGKRIALANKESMVMAGEIIVKEMAASGARILPVDSEHSAIWQCLNGEQAPRHIILTASGGPFRGYSQEQLASITPAQALRHPSWKMGKKVTIDSATLMNKGLEVIEARWLFNMPVHEISVLVHPQSIVHSMVEFADGSVKAQLGFPDMRLPIQYALTYPERLTNDTLPRLDWNGIKALTFELPDTEGFPCLRLGIEAGKNGGTFPSALCAADEVAVEAFLAGRIRFTDIPRIIEKVLSRHINTVNPSLEDVIAADALARKEAAEKLQKGI